MSLGDDIKETLVDGGNPVTILRPTGDISGEYLRLKVNAQVTKPFIREFFMESQLAYDTRIIPGDVVRVSDGRIFLVMNKTPELFEGSPYRYSAVFYKCNVSGSLFRPTSEKVNYKTVASWTEVRNPCYALMTESRYGHELDEDAEIGPVSLASMECYMPHAVGAQKGDRYVISESEYYQVESIRTRHFDSVDLLALGEDTRGPMA